MRTWNVNFASVGRWFAKRLLCENFRATLATLLLLTAGYALAQPAEATKQAARRP